MSITKEEYLKAIEVESEIIEKKFSINDLDNKEDRTLLYGYNTDRTDVHLFVKNGDLYLESNNEVNLITEEGIKYNLIKPSKRAYPESTDLEFLNHMVKKGEYISFTTYNEERYKKVKDKTFHGKIV